MKLCKYGCGREGLYPVKHGGGFSCSTHHTKCPVNQKKTAVKSTGRKFNPYCEVENPKELCKFGCGQIGKYIAKNGEFCCSNNSGKCPVNRKKMSESHKGKHHSEKTKQQMSEARKGEKNPNYGKPRSKETIEKMRKALKGKKRKPRSEESRNKQKEIMKKLWDDPNSVYRTKKYIEYRSRFMKEQWKDPDSIFNSKEFRKKRSEITKDRWNDSNSIYHTEEYWEKVNIGEDSRPNKPETIILNLLNNIFPNEWEYVGDYKFWIDGKNPDFVNSNKKKIIEHFGTWYHGKEMTGIDNKIHEQERVEHFEKEGYETLIIWENELKNIGELKRKIIKFNGDV